MFKSELLSAKYRTSVWLYSSSQKEDKTKIWDDVKEIIFAGSYSHGILKSIPPDISEVFPKLTRLSFDSQGFNSISRDDLKGLEKLEMLSFAHCELKSLPGNLFENMKNLKEISFYNNKLGDVGSSLLKPIIGNGLEWVDFQHNNNIDAYFSKQEEGGISLQRLVILFDTQCSTQASLQAPDFTIITKDYNKIAVHKFVLKLSSAVFTAMLEHETQENIEDCLMIEDFEPEAVQDFFTFLYTGYIPSEENAMELLALADMYDIPELKLMSEKIITKNINNSNAHEIFSFAHLYSLMDLKKKAFASIQEIFPDRQQEDALFEDPAGLKELVQESARLSRKRRIKEAVEETFAAISAYGRSFEEVKDDH